MVADLTTSPHPLCDAHFALEARRSQEHILRWWDYMGYLEAAPKKRRAAGEISRQTGLSIRTIITLRWKFRRRGCDWRALANRSRWPDPRDCNLPAPFVAWVKSLNETNQRETSFANTYRLVMTALDRWERAPHDKALAIPGYDAPPKRNPFKGYPVGWSQRNLAHHCASNPYEKALRRQGPKRASEFLPSVRSSRVGLDYGQIVYFDDQDHDTYVNLTGINQVAVRPQSFNALECLSASCLEVGLKPQIWDGDVRRELNQLDFFWFVMLFLTKHGYNARTGTTLVWEHGKANPDKTGEFDRALEQATNGKVRTDKSGLWREPAFKTMLFEGQASGNYRFKAPIESSFNLIRNYSGMLPAATGRNRDLAPEENASADVPRSLLGENKRLLALIDKLEPERFLRLRRPVLEWEDYRRIHLLVMDAIDRRRDHSLEGWRKLGFTGARYRLSLDSQDWIDEASYLKIAPEKRALYDEIVRQPGHCETFLLSPYEVRMGMRSRLTKLPTRLIPVLAPERAWEDVAVAQNLEMTIADKWLDSEPLVFWGKVTTPQGYEVMLERGKTYKRLLNLFDPSMLWIAERDGSRKGAFIGTATRQQLPCKADYEGLLRVMGEKAHVKSVESFEVHSRMSAEALDRVATRVHNRAIEKGEPVTPEEKAASRVDRRRLHEIQRSLTEADLAAATASSSNGSPNEEISADEMARYFSSSEPTEGDQW